MVFHTLVLQFYLKNEQKKEEDLIPFLRKKSARMLKAVLPYL